MRILICGGRDWAHDDKREVELFVEAWSKLMEKHGYDIEIVNGGCKTGVDRIARAACAATEVTCITEPAKWSKSGKAAGAMRNQLMIDKWQPQAAVAFPGHRGTADMVRRCRVAKIPVWIPYGGVQE